MGMLRRLGADQRGTIGVMFGMALLPLAGLVGAAVDYSRAAAEQSRLQRAVDAVAVALAREPSTLTQGQLQARATSVFGSVYAARDTVALGTLSVNRDDSAVTVSAAGSAQNAFMQLVGLRRTPLGASAQSAWGTQRIELALVLDNTGSMAESIGGQRKIDALKASALKLLSDLRGVATDAESVKVSVVPFDTEVRLDPATYRNKKDTQGNDWIRWTNPSSSQERNSWTGYLIDRYSPYDVSDAAPDSSVSETLYPKLATSQWAAYGDLATVRPLTSLYDGTTYSAVVATVNAMSPRGNTNVGLGVSWGTATLTRSVPLGTTAASAKAGVKRFMVVLTDGTNTQKWVNGVAMAVKNPSNPSPTDPVTLLMNDRTRQACATAKSAPGGIEVFTIRLLDGDTTLLQSCASDSSHYFDVQNSAQLSNAFQSITGAITGTRLTH